MKGPDRNPSSLKLPASTGLVLLRRSGLELVRPLQTICSSREVRRAKVGRASSEKRSAKIFRPQAAASHQRQVGSTALVAALDAT